jgi:hypothetical protein
MGENVYYEGKKNFECGLRVVVVDENNYVENRKELFERERKAREKKKKILNRWRKGLKPNN